MWVTIETRLGNGKRFLMDVETQGLFKINPNWTGKRLEFKDRIMKICVTDDMIVIQTTDRDLRSGQTSSLWIKDNREINNVDAYDHDGKHLWNIGSIIGDIKMQIDSVYHITAHEAKKMFGIKVSRCQKNLFSCTAGEYLMVIDGVQQKMLFKKAGMVR